MSLSVMTHDEAIAKLYPLLLRRFPQAEPLKLVNARFRPSGPGLPELAKLREIVLEENEMAVDELLDFIQALLQQDAVNVESLRVLSKSARNGAPTSNSGGRSDAKDQTSPSLDPRFWTDEMRKLLKGDFCVQFS